VCKCLCVSVSVFVDACVCVSLMCVGVGGIVIPETFDLVGTFAFFHPHEDTTCVCVCVHSVFCTFSPVAVYFNVAI